MNPEEAKIVLTHYFKKSYQAAELIWGKDNDFEMAELVDQILSEPRQVIRMLRADIVQLSGRIDRLEEMHRNVQ